MSTEEPALGSMIVVSNRLPFVLKRNEENEKLERIASAGGLVTAVAPVVVQTKGIWVGWPGHLDDINEPIPEADPNDKTPTAGLLSEKVVCVHVDRELFDSYYNGCCNGTLWPLCHSMPDRAQFSADNWKAYTRVNEMFADHTMHALQLLQKDKPANVIPLIWIHDYHLMLMATWVRQAADDAGLRFKLGFFLHIPFPPWDIFRLFPWGDEILQGMLGERFLNFLYGVMDVETPNVLGFLISSIIKKGKKKGICLTDPLPRAVLKELFVNKPTDCSKSLNVIAHVAQCKASKISYHINDIVIAVRRGNDMIGFHIEDYCINFIDCCQRRLGCRVDRRNFLVEHGGRTVRIRPLPIGVPFDRFVNLATVAPKVMYTNQKIVLGVDRLDYTKGLVHRLKAFERLLEKHPEHKENVTLLQISVPSRTDVKEYQDLKEEMDQLVGRINGRFSTYNWTPIRYIYGCVSQDELAGFYRDAAVALVTPLRDGMNLVAKEFVACQINQPPGVLIVSPFAGAGETMHEALICNPYEIDEAAEVIHRALTMPEDERTLRMNYLRRREKANDVNFWLRSFMKQMGPQYDDEDAEIKSITMNPVTVDDFEDYLAEYIGHTNKVALLLDYDGTLAPIAPHPDLAILPVETKNVLQRLSNMSDVFVAIISGRSVDNVKEMVGIEGITYAGNHGLEILHSDGSKFVHPVPIEQVDKVRDLLRSLQDKVCRDGAWVENKGAVLTFHYRESPRNTHATLERQARSLIESFGFKVGISHFALEARPPVQWNKGRASLYILRTAFGYDWSERIRIIYAGDDVTDEDAMQALKGMAATFRVASSSIIRTAAERRLPNTDSVLMMLKWLERHLGIRKPVPEDGSRIAKSKNVSRSASNLKVEMSFVEMSTTDQENGGPSYDEQPREASIIKLPEDHEED